MGGTIGKLGVLGSVVAIAASVGGCAWRPDRRLAPGLLALPGAAGVLDPLHVASDVPVLRTLIWLGLALLLAGAALDTWLSHRARRSCRAGAAAASGS